MIKDLSAELQHMREMLARSGEDKKRMAADPNFVPEPFEAKAPVTDDEHLAAEAGAMKAGDRCEVTAPGMGRKRGEVKYVGKIPQIAPGWWVGVVYDEPVGKNDGSVKGRRCFECNLDYGGFVRPDKIQPDPDPPATRHARARAPPRVTRWCL